MRHGRSFHQHFELMSQWLTITLIVCISPLAMTQDAVLKFGSNPIVRILFLIVYLAEYAAKVGSRISRNIFYALMDS
jgi:hypothetical protein